VNAWVADKNTALGADVYLGWTLEESATGYPVFGPMPKQPGGGTLRGVLISSISVDTVTGDVTLRWDPSTQNLPLDAVYFIHVSSDLSNPDGWTRHGEDAPGLTFIHGVPTTVIINAADMNLGNKAFFKVLAMDVL
ncbi:MAG: hypothetical protein FWF96_05430, partial [Kiritimatiellaeota bacterium]|nr:hypothetical protein [Kiritimatiellota bacterium]